MTTNASDRPSAPEYDPGLEGPDFNRLLTFVALSDEKAALDARLKVVKDELAALSDLLATQFALAGVPRMTVNGRTVYLHRQVWASVQPEDGDLDAAFKVLERYDMGWMVKPTVNSQTLSARIREMEKEFEGLDFQDFLDSLPPDLRDALRITEKFEVRSRKS